MEYTRFELRLKSFCTVCEKYVYIPKEKSALYRNGSYDTRMGNLVSNGLRHGDPPADSPLRPSRVKVALLNPFAHRQAGFIIVCRRAELQTVDMFQSLSLLPRNIDRIRFVFHPSLPGPSTSKQTKRWHSAQRGEAPILSPCA
jgi:hypothetical protein